MGKIRNYRVISLIIVLTCFHSINSQISKESFTELIITFTKLINKDSNNVLYLAARAEAFSDLNNFKSALKDINKAIKINNKDWQNYFTRGVIYHNLGKSILAVKDFNKALSISNESIIYTARGISFYDLGKYDKTIKDCTNALSLNKNDVFALYYLSLISKKIKNKKLFNFYYKQSMEIGLPKVLKVLTYDIQ